jgi:DNA-binding LacI/PurR family transcriptional regulator
MFENFQLSWWLLVLHPQRSQLALVKRAPSLVTKGSYPASQRIFEALREQIKSGRHAPGTQLPGTRELAATWKASVFTVHTALKWLANEGWIDRRPYVGTFIADPARRFLCAGIYHAFDISSGKHTAFMRYLHFALLQQFQRLKKDTQLFNDSRPPHEQGPLFPPLAEAIAQRRIQCLVALSINRIDLASLQALTLPTAYLSSNPYSPHRVDYDLEDLVRGSVRRLARQGCRSVGIISSVTKNSPFRLYPLFEKVVREEGLSTQPAWIRRPIHSTCDLDIFGYTELKKLWALRKKPDGLIVYPDTVAQGVTTAILELGLHVVRDRMKFVFHRNAHLGFLCPFPVTWVISDEDRMARGLVELILQQFRGEPEAGPVFLPYEFSDVEISIPAQH